MVRFDAQAGQLVNGRPSRTVLHVRRTVPERPSLRSITDAVSRRVTTLPTNLRITATVLWIPKRWRRCGEAIRPWKYRSSILSRGATSAVRVERIRDRYERRCEGEWIHWGGLYIGAAAKPCAPTASTDAGGRRWRVGRQLEFECERRRARCSGASWLNRRRFRWAYCSARSCRPIISPHSGVPSARFAARVRHAPGDLSDSHADAHTHSVCRARPLP
jgi:hypothetical protein